MNLDPRNSGLSSSPDATWPPMQDDGWDWLVRLGVGRRTGCMPPAGFHEVLRRHCRTLPSSAGGTPPLGRPCPLAAALWHAERLGELLADGVPTGPADQARLAYHGRWILRLSAPLDPRWRALVSVVIPVFNRAELVCEAIASALAQTHPAMEVIVVDDGSTDDLTERLSRFDDQIRLLRQPRRGVSLARNRGLSAALGDYINFLDSDDRLDPGWTEAALQAFEAIADADLCYAAPRQKTWPAADLFRPAYLEPLRGHAHCPSQGLMPVVAASHPFLMLGVMMPRWQVLDLGGFDTTLPRGEDTRFWFRLGLRKAKVIGLDRQWNERRLLPSGLSSTAPPGTIPGVALINLVDLLGWVEHWPQVPTLLETLSEPRRWRALEATSDPGFQQAGRDLLTSLAGLVRRGRLSGHSPRPVLLAIQQLFRALPQRCRRPVEALSLAQELARAADAALADCPPCGEADRQLWLGDSVRPTLTVDSEITLALMRDRGWWNLDPPAASFWQDLGRAIRCHTGRPPDPALPVGVIGRPAALPALAHHRNALVRLCRAAPSDVHHQRLAYHADWLLSLLGHARQGDGPVGPRVSVVIPEFNRADTIVEAVGCCLDQTYPRLEILVVDDGSSQDIAAALQAFLSQIRLLRQEPNRGAGATRNLGIREARGTLIHFLDADDLLEADAIARKVEALAAIADADLVFSGARQLGEAAQEIGQELHYLQPPPRPRHCPSDSLLETLSGRYPFLTSTVLVSRWRLNEAGLFDPVLRRGEDEELFLRLALNQVKPVGIDGHPTLRRISERSLSIARPEALELAHYHLRCLTDLLMAPAMADAVMSALFRRHWDTLNLALLVADRSEITEQVRQRLGVALRARQEEAASGACLSAARLQLAWCQEQLRAHVERLPALASDPWMRALTMLTALQQPEGSP